jgi:uncharacterized membrane protein YbaN (DUF454 family)
VGIIGIFVPGLPTTAFLLLTAALYMKGSEKLYRKLLGNRILGPYITEFQNNKGMTKRTKIQAIGTMWFMILISSIFFIDPYHIKFFVISLGIAGTVVMGYIIPTVDKAKKDED